MTPMSDQDRRELDWVKSSPIGGLRGGPTPWGVIGCASDRQRLWGRFALARLPLSKLFLLAGLSLWVSMIFRFNEDRKSIQRIDDLLERDDLDPQR
jgi:hypothetical protein